MSEKLEKQMLSSQQKNIIHRGEFLNDMHIKHFNHLLRNCSDYKPVETWQLHFLHTIQPISENNKHIQILLSSSGPCASDEHWVCSYYDNKNLFIYDSLNKKKFHDNYDKCLRRLFPTYPFNKRPVRFPTVQHQLNDNDSGIFAIAFAISLLYNVKPEKVKYNYNLMRFHLINIFESNVIEHFPQDSKYGVIQKVLPLALLKMKEAEATRMRNMRQNKKQQKQSKQLQLKTEFSNVVQKQDIFEFEKVTDETLINNCAKEISTKNCEHINDKHRQIYLENEKHNKRQYQEISVINVEKQKTLSSDQKEIILQGDWLNDMHMEHFEYLVKNCSDYRPVETWKLQLLDQIQPIPENKKHIQILYSSSGPGALDGHWVCSYYDGKNIFIYDSLNKKNLHRDHEQFLRRLFPTYSFDQLPVQFPIVQQQPNGNDCGVFAIAFAVSLLFNIKPEKVKYDYSLMRLHLIKVFECNVIEHFPQDSKCIPQKVLPLAMIKTEETVLPSTIQNNKIEAQRLNMLENVENIGNNITLVDNIVEQIDNKCDKEKTKNIKNLEPTNNTILIDNFVLKIKNNESNKEGNENKRLYLESHARYEQHQYKKNLENNRAKKRRRYGEDLEENRAKKQRLYVKDLEHNRAKKQRLYVNNLEHNRAKKRCWYIKDLDKYRASKRRRYNANSVMRRMQERKHYSALMQNEQSKQKILERKWYYNKEYYKKKKEAKSNKNMDHVINNCNIVNKITKKYKTFQSKKCIKFCGSLTLCKKNIFKKLNIKDSIEKQLEADKIIRWCMHIRNNYIRKMYHILAVLRKKSEVCLTIVAKSCTIDKKLDALCGISRHTSSSENYFIDSIYHKATLQEPLIINMEGQVVNALPLITAQAKKSWSCSTSCKIDNPILIERYEQFLESVTVCTLNKVPMLIKNIHECTVKTSNIKLGHAQSCYIDFTLCKAMFLPILLLSPHFPKVRNIKRLIYQLTNVHRKMLNLDKALTDADLNILNVIVNAAQEKADIYKRIQTDTILSDDDIFFKYQKAFQALKKRLMDTPRYACVSCERLCYKRNVTQVKNIRAIKDVSLWKDVIAYVKKQQIEPQYICIYCKQKFSQGLMPAYCILNKLSVDNVPEVISSLNTFEKILIQRAKAFQTVVKMGTVMNKKLPQRAMVQKVKGRTFHLPLPMQETLNKLCSETDAINTNHELYILVRGIPTKSKIVWEEMVNVKKVFDALIWLKNNNPLYSGIILLPNTHDEFYLDKLNNLEFQIQEDENVEKLDEERESLNNSKPKREEMDNLENVAFNQHEAMLTQVINENDGYEQYTIYPLYEKRMNKTATALYQLLKVQNMHLDNREKCLDLLCFPDLYPFGINGQREIRQVKLYDHEFIKCRLMSKHPQYRLNQQYLFYLLNDTNMRQLNRGIFQKMNVTNSQVRYTAKGYLEAMSKELLESDLSTIFSTLRNTEQFWRKPRSDLNCMTQHYGPATWFLTLSPGEWLWAELGEYIREVNGWYDTSLCTSVLVAKDPVSTSRFLDNMLWAMLDFICSEDHPIGEVTHYFWRREYQGRGIQHFHILIWIKDAPILGESSIEEVSEFILRYISCKMPDKNISPLLYRRVNTHQLHKHNDYCLRSKKIGRKIVRRCRFAFPRLVTETLNIRNVASAIVEI